MFGGSGPDTRPKNHAYRRIWDTGNGPNAPVRLPSIKTPVRKLSSVVVSFCVVFGSGRGTDVAGGPAGSRRHRTFDGERRLSGWPCGHRGDRVPARSGSPMGTEPPNTFKPD